ncbi:hypothetical protein HDV04_002767 [Boothiomyces sp. JEL0838]|nr:hypothetical protein HDV04_002767 [Boothiomyces sp. JEL0838]
MKIKEIQLISRSEPSPKLKDYELHLDLFQQIKENENILDYRKLREILLYSERRDSFTVQVLTSNIYHCIMKKDWNELLVCLLSILDLEQQQEMIGYLILLKTRLNQPIISLLKSENKMIEFNCAFTQNNFYKLGIIYNEMNEYEKTIVKGTFEQRILNSLKRSFYTLPIQVVAKYMVIHESECKDYGLEGPVIELKKRK